MSLRYALFNDPEEAERALSALEKEQRDSDDVSFHIHPAKDAAASFGKGTQMLRETDAFRGAIYGGLIGALGAAVLIGVMMFTALLPGDIGVGPVGAMLVGGFYGLVGGFVAGAAVAHGNLRELVSDRSSDGTLVTIVSDSDQASRRIDTLLNEYTVKERTMQFG